MRYDIELNIDYAYDYPVTASRHIVRLMPADLPGEQRMIAARVTASLHGDEWLNQHDFFGNAMVQVAFRKPHQDVRFTLKARVERLAQSYVPEGGITLEALGAQLDAEKSLDAHSPLHFMAPSVRAPITPETTAYAQNLIGGATTIGDIISRIGGAIDRDFTYDPKATKVDTPMQEAFAGRHGVCQDFSHVMIAALRGIGVPAGYVSGFLRTNPPAGQARLEGADAMHAWVCAWCGKDIGWVEYDPTNGVFVGQDHIVIGRGRDYFDVAPIKGVMRAFGGHKTTQAVDVIPIDG